MNPHRLPWRGRLAVSLLAAWMLLSPAGARWARAGSLDDLVRPQEGRSMRATSTMRQGEERRGDKPVRLDPKAAPRGDDQQA